MNLTILMDTSEFKNSSAFTDLSIPGCKTFTALATGSEHDTSFNQPLSDHELCTLDYHHFCLNLFSSCRTWVTTKETMPVKYSLVDVGGNQWLLRLLRKVNLRWLSFSCRIRGRGGKVVVESDSNRMDASLIPATAWPCFMTTSSSYIVR